jgi:hypothetical protein
MTVVFNDMKKSYLKSLDDNNNDNGLSENKTNNNILTISAPKTSNISTQTSKDTTFMENHVSVHVPFGIHNLRKKTGTMMANLFYQRQISFEEYNTFVLSELHDINTSERYYIEQVYGPNRVRPTQRIVSYQGSIDEILSLRSENIKKGT